MKGMNFDDGVKPRLNNYNLNDLPLHRKWLLSYGKMEIDERPLVLVMANYEGYG